MVTPEPPSGTFLRLLHPAQAKIVPADSARNWKVWKFYFLPSTQRTKAEWSCFPERHKNQKWCLYCAWTGSRVHAPACCPVWHPSEESVPHAVPDGSFLCTHRHFLPLARKMSPEEQRRCTASRGRELGHLKTKQKKMALWRKEEREQNLARSENPGWIFTSFFSSKNLKPSALYKPWTCSNSSFIDFPDNRAAESHLIHLWDLVRTSKYNGLQNTWNCWQRKHFLPNSVGQQTQSRPCNYIPPRSTFAAM